MNKKCVALTKEEYIESIKFMHEGFVLEGHYTKPNPRMATIETLQATLGLRLGDILNLKLSSFIKDGQRWRLDIREEKTGKERNFTVPVEVYSFVQDYAYERGISKDAKLFDISKRAVQLYLNRVFQRMGKNPANYGSHSYRKYFSNKVYEESDYNIELVRLLLQHSSVQTTQRYLGVGTKAVEEALASTAESIVWFN